MVELHFRIAPVIGKRLKHYRWIDALLLWGFQRMLERLDCWRMALGKDRSRHWSALLQGGECASSLGWSPLLWLWARQHPVGKAACFPGQRQGQSHEEDGWIYHQSHQQKGERECLYVSWKLETVERRCSLYLLTWRKPYTRLEWPNLYQ